MYQLCNSKVNHVLALDEIDYEPVPSDDPTLVRLKEIFSKLDYVPYTPVVTFRYTTTRGKYTLLSSEVHIQAAIEVFPQGLIDVIVIPDKDTDLVCEVVHSTSTNTCNQPTNQS